MKLSVIIPAYNEERLLNSTLQQVWSYLVEQAFTSEIIVVNDGSIDNTRKIAENWQPKIKLINHSQRQGKGATVRTGMLNANGDWLLFMDADSSTHIEELNNFLPNCQKGYEVIIASRALKDSRILPQPWYKCLAGRIGSILIRLLAVPNIKDTQCGFKLFSKKAGQLFKQQTLKGFGFDFEILFLAIKKDYRILEVPISWINRPESSVKFKDYFKTLNELIKIRINDIKRKYV